MMYGAGVSTSPQTRSSVGARVAKSDAHTGTSPACGAVGDGAELMKVQWIKCLLLVGVVVLLMAAIFQRFF